MIDLGNVETEVQRLTRWNALIQFLFYSWQVRYTSRRSIKKVLNSRQTTETRELSRVFHAFPSRLKQCICTKLATSLLLHPSRREQSSRGESSGCTREIPRYRNDSRGPPLYAKAEENTRASCNPNVMHSSRIWRDLSLVPPRSTSRAACATRRLD